MSCNARLGSGTNLPCGGSGHGARQGGDGNRSTVRRLELDSWVVATISHSLYGFANADGREPKSKPPQPGHFPCRQKKHPHKVGTPLSYAFDASVLGGLFFWCMRGTGSLDTWDGRDVGRHALALSFNLQLVTVLRLCSLVRPCTEPASCGLVYGTFEWKRCAFCGAVLRWDSTRQVRMPWLPPTALQRSTETVDELSREW